MWTYSKASILFLHLLSLNINNYQRRSFLDDVKKCKYFIWKPLWRERCLQKWARIPPSLPNSSRVICLEMSRNPGIIKICKMKGGGWELKVISSSYTDVWIPDHLWPSLPGLTSSLAFTKSTPHLVPEQTYLLPHFHPITPCIYILLHREFTRSYSYLYECPTSSSDCDFFKPGVMSN